MAKDWASYCNAPDLTVDGPHITLDFGDDRRHLVTVKEEPDAYIISGFVARQAVVASLPNLPVDIWLRNRAVTLMGFRIDRRGRLLGEAWVPKIGLTAEEFQLYLRTVAVECDRFEYILTGRDVE
ncbi:MAG: hypothetical protein AB7U20_05195 [Planctomycetaceae bacterium]